jgi:hypothetical protein
MLLRWLGAWTYSLMDRREWIEAFAAMLKAPPLTEDDTEVVLALAAEAAHASERTAAPLACWIAAKAGVSTRQALDAARQVPGVAPDAD